MSMISINKYNFYYKEIDPKTDQNLTEQEENNILSQQIAARIIQVHEKVEKAIMLYNEHQLELNHKNSSSNNDQEIDEEQEENKRVLQVLELPLNVKYKILLENLRFGYFSMIDRNSNANQYHHHYKAQISQNQNPSQAKMIRLAQEVADMANSLPVDYTNSVFVRCDSKRVDVMKCIIMGSKGTPYANGAFLYDVFFEDTYPNSSPKVNLQTTGNGKVRFNPNLYNCGKVCLSLLGTWKGQASENWDPKISTLLQVLVSLQAIIMNEDIYFNEPGYEGHNGTEEGDKKNEGYSNIVRYCNIKYAMIESIRNPPEGFEEIIRRHFYLKKHEILIECEEWIERSNKKLANYTGLVHDHNPLICQEFKQANKYSEMLNKAVQELRQELEKLTPPSSVDTPEQIAKKKARKLEQQNRKKHISQQYKEKPSIFKKEVGQIHNALNDQESIETPFAKNLTNMGEEIDIESEEVKDRWSRYICAMGIDAVAKQSKCSIFLSGLGPLGVEIAKNIVLSGVKRITLHDTQIISQKELSGQFFLRKEHIGRNRADACLQDIQLLNHYVRVDKNTNEMNTNTSTFLEKLNLQDYNVVILAENYSFDILTSINTFCRERSIKFIAAQVQGPFASLFNDFGDNFEVIDKNGEDPLEVIISNIEQVSLQSSQQNNEKIKLKVTLLAGTKHSYEDKDRVLIKEVKGMSDLQDETKSINDNIFEIQTINTNSFYLLSNTSYSPYEGSGIAKNIKTPINLTFSSLKHCLQNYNTSTFDQNMLIHDFEKLQTIPYLHIAFISLQEFVQLYSRYPLPWNTQDANSLIAIAKIHYESFDLPSKTDEKIKQQFQQYITKFSFTVTGTFHPLCAFMGGFVSQEIIKAITNKYIPTKQYFYTDCVEVLPDINWEDLASSSQQIQQLQNIQQGEATENSDAQLKLVIGNQLCEKIAHSKLFMVGSGAIGCELLKNFAMISLCTGDEIPERNLKKGQLTLTDPDHIETSNLNRQFLFREEHLRKPKSSTAASSAIKMNNKLKDHIVACLDKVCEGTKNIFTDNFFEEQDIVANALDNIEARRYVDMRCVSSKTPLLESGTLGPKGHVQVIIPYKTESYGSQQDPQDEGGDIPHCTLKMFPEETLHCVEWARDKFGKMVTFKPKVVQKTLDEIEQIKQGTATGDIKNLRKTLKALKNRPLSFEDCIEFAVKKFYKFYRNNIRQLLHTYPLNHKTKDGSDFWKLPKRAPKEIPQLDKENTLHRDFIAGVSIMKAKIYDLPYPKNFRQSDVKKSIMQIAMNIKIPDFSPSDEKSNEIESEVNNTMNGEMVSHEQQQQNSDSDTDLLNNNVIENNQTIIANDENALYLIEQIIEQKKKLQQQTIIQSEEFEKDADSNGHIDFIYAVANLRSINYSLTPMDWLTVKLKAGKIVPALATTTAAVAGLQTIELVKTLKNINLSKMKNAFLNLAVPSLQLTEPAAPPTYNITSTIKSNIWDRWELKLKKSDSLQHLFNYFEQEMKLNVFNILIGTELLYAFTMSEDDKQSILENTFVEIINNNQYIDNDAKYLDLAILFTEVNSKQILSNTPSVRVYFKSNDVQQP